MQNPFAFVKTPTLGQPADQYSLGQKQALINALKQAAINPEPTPQYGAIASRTSPITPIVQALMGYKAGKDQSALNAEVQDLTRREGEKAIAMMQPITAPPVGDVAIDPNAMGPPANLANSSQPSPMNPGGLDPKMAAQLYQALGPKEYSSQYVQPYNDPQAKQKQSNWEAEQALRVAAANKVKESPTADGLVWDGKSYRDPDGNVLNADQVRDWKAKLSGARADATTKAKQVPGTSLSEQAIDLAARRLLNGEKARDVLANFGRGNQGAADLRAVQNRFAELAYQNGTDAADIATKVQELSAENRTRTELGAREGKIAPRVQEAQNFAKIALDASAKVPRGNWTSYNKAIQWKDAQFSDPQLRAFNAANVSLINAYAAAIGGGTIHVHDQEVGQKLLQTADSPEAYAAVVKQLLTETRAALDAPKQVMKDLRGKDETVHWDDLK